MKVRINRLVAIIKKEFIHIKRDKASIIIAVMMPLVFILMFGYAVNTDVDQIKMAVLDMDKSQSSRELLDKFTSSDYFKITNYAKNKGQIEDYIDRGIVKSAIIIPANFSKAMEGYEESSIQLIIDGVDPTVAKTALQSGVLISRNYAMEILQDQSISEISTNLDVRSKVWYNPNLESVKFTIPGLIGLIMQNITVLLTAFAIVREKESGTMELLIVTPIKPLELILGKMIPYILIGTVDFLIALFFGTWWFGVEVKGSLTLLIVLGILFVICALSIGILISTIAQNQGQAMQMSLLFILPSVLLSGFVFPRDAMPFPIRNAGNLIPLTYFLNILRGIMLKGIGVEFLLQDIVILSVFSVVLLLLASFKFRKKLD